MTHCVCTSLLCDSVYISETMQDENRKIIEQQNRYADPREYLGQ